MIINQDRINRNIRDWCLAMEACHEMILAGLRRKIGPEANLDAVYRQWYRHQCDLASERLERDAARIRPAKENAE